MEDKLREQVDQRSTEAGEQVTAVSKALRSSREQLRSEGNETPAKLIDGAAQQVDRIGSYLRDSDSNRILCDAESWRAAAPGSPQPRASSSASPRHASSRPRAAGATTS